MIHSFFSAILILSVLSSCASTIDKTIPLSNEFVINSKAITLENPAWKIPDTIYNIELDEYSIKSSKTSWRSSDKSVVDRKKDSSFLNYILFDDDLSFITEEFEDENTQVFSFNLVKGDLFISTSACEVFSKSFTKKTSAKDLTSSNSGSQSSLNTRLKTYLVCAITHNKKHWRLTLASANEEKIEAQLTSSDFSYDIQNVSKVISLIKDGDVVERKSSPPWLSFKSGLKFFHNKEQVAALSFVGKPKIWLSNDLPTESKELLLSVNYSLVMFNWLDSNWRQ